MKGGRVGMGAAAATGLGKKSGAGGSEEDVGGKPRPRQLRLVSEKVLGNRGLELKHELKRRPDWRTLGGILKNKFPKCGESRRLREIALNLSEPSVECYREALLLSIDDGDEDLAEAITAVMVDQEVDITRGCTASPFFAPHITPLLLACLKNDFHIVAVYLRLGIRLLPPHLSNCSCLECADELEYGESAERAIARIDTFRGFASSAYLFLSAHDPFLLAIDLASDLHKAMDYEPQNRDKYAAIQRQVQAFAAKLASLLRNHEEVKLVLGKSEGIQLPSNDFVLPRLRLALDARMKDFLAQFEIQTEISRVWQGSWADMRVKASGLWLWRWASVTLLYPFTALLHLCSAGFLLTDYKTSPLARFAAFFSSYVAFVAALFVFIEFRQDPDTRGPPQEILLLILLVYIWLYVFGLAFWDFLRVFKYGPKRFLAVWWTWTNVVMYLVFSMAFCSWVQAAVTAGQDGLQRVDRAHWQASDPQLLFEALFGVGAILATFRVLYFLQLLRVFGPTVISVGRCTRDILEYCVVIGIVMLSFAVGLNFIYQPYHFEQGAFRGIRLSTLNLYWSFFGHLAPSDLGLSKGQANGAAVGQVGLDGVVREHALAYYFGSAVVVIYNVLIVVVLLNLMVAMMCNSAGEIIMNENVEWKFVRCAIWAEFMEADNALPPPLNLLWWWVTWIPFLVSPRHRFQFWPPNLWYYHPRNQTKLLHLYKQLMLALFHRYSAQKKQNFVSAATLEKADPNPSLLDDHTDRIENIVRKRHTNNPTNPTTPAKA